MTKKDFAKALRAYANQTLTILGVALAGIGVVLMAQSTSETLTTEARHYAGTLGSGGVRAVSHRVCGAAADERSATAEPHLRHAETHGATQQRKRGGRWPITQ